MTILQDLNILLNKFGVVVNAAVYKFINVLKVKYAQANADKNIMLEIKYFSALNKNIHDATKIQKTNVCSFSCV